MATFEPRLKTEQTASLIGPSEVARLLGVSRSWVVEHSNGRRRPVLPSIKLGKSVRFDPQVLARFLLACSRNQEKTPAK